MISSYILRGTPVISSRKFKLTKALGLPVRMTVATQSASTAVDSTGKPTVVVDIISDTVCPWCYVGKRRLEAATKLVADKVNVEARWHPYQLNPTAPVEGVNKLEYYESKFGRSRTQQMIPQMKKTFSEFGIDYSLGGLTGNTFDSHRLIHYAGRFGAAKQDALVERLFDAYFSKEKFINDREVLLAAAEAAGIEGAAEYLANPNNGRQEVQQEIEKAFSQGVSGVPNFSIGRMQVSGAQDPQTLAAAIERAAASQQQ